MLLVVSGSASLPGGVAEELLGDPTGPGPVGSAGGSVGLVSLAEAAGSVDRLVAVINTGLDHPHHRSALVLCDPGCAAQTRRAVAFARHALRIRQVATLVVNASPLRIAVVAAVVERLVDSGHLSVSDVPVAVNHLVRRTSAVMMARSVSRLRRPRPSLRARLTVLPRGSWFVAQDTDSRRAVRTMSDRSPQSALRLSLPVRGGDSVVAVARRPGDDVSPLLDDLDPARVVEVGTHHSWWRRWASPHVVELVVAPADLGLEAAAIRQAVSASWLCSWCGERIQSLSSCAGCGAWFRSATAALPEPVG
ncbi:MAG: hypothetical protein ACFCVF_10205 [Kineosporiaceae bacterium]